MLRGLQGCACKARRLFFDIYREGAHRCALTVYHTLTRLSPVMDFRTMARASSPTGVPEAACAWEPRCWWAAVALGWVCTSAASAARANPKTASAQQPGWPATRLSQRQSEISWRLPLLRALKLAHVIDDVPAVARGGKILAHGRHRPRYAVGDGHEDRAVAQVFHPVIQQVGRLYFGEER